MCHAPYQCPECHSTNLVKYGFNYSINKQNYICKDCGRCTITPECPICPKNKPPLAILQKLSKSGRRCLTCGEPLIYCPECGQRHLTRHGYHRWTTKLGEERSVERWKCSSCGSITIRNKCACDFPDLSPQARKELERRLRAKAREVKSIIKEPRDIVD